MPFARSLTHALLSAWFAFAVAFLAMALPPLAQQAFGQVPEVGYIPPEAPDASLAGFFDAALKIVTTDPSTLFLLKSAALVLMIIAMTAGLQKKFKRLQEDTDLTKLMVMGVALAFGVFFGLVGVAPDVPRFEGRMATFLGGVTCGAIAMTGASFLSRAKGAIDELRSAKAVVEEKP